VSKRARLYFIALLFASVFATWGFLRLRSAPPRAVVPTTVETAPVVEAAHITATLFYASSDGRALVPVKRDVPLASNIVEQGRQILMVQLQDAPQPYLRVVPTGTSLRAFYVTDRGDAFVDMSPEIVSRHPGGSLNELMTVYALVNAVIANLPAIQRVQLLVDGKEVDTIAGHVDARRPLERDTSLVRDTSGSKELKTQDSKLKQEDSQLKQKQGPRPKPGSTPKRDSKP
jgi:hypothetical protein